MTDEQKYVVGVGAANVDVHGRSRNALVMRDSNPGRMNTSAGGVTRNILENIARLGARTKLISAIGDDVYGEKIIRDSTRAGIDMSHCIHVEKSASSTYMSLLDNTGDMFIALSDMSIAQNITKQALDGNREMIRGASVVVTDPCIKTETLKYLVEDTAKGVAVFVDPVSTYYASTIADFIGLFHTVKPNELELEILSGIKITDEKSIDRACTELLNKGVQRVFVSRGKNGCYYKDAAGNTTQRRLEPLDEMVNATGAGDAFMGALTYSWVNGFDIEKTIDYALAAGILAILAYETISPLMNVDLIEKTIKERTLK
ncbi:MAG: PfkB family carbohydrate kinase [Oscillospiraceae bacterium]